MTRMRVALFVFVAATAVLLAGTAISPAAASGQRDPVGQKKPSTAADQHAEPRTANENVSADAAKKKKSWLQWLRSPFKRKPSEKKPSEKKPSEKKRFYKKYGTPRLFNKFVALFKEQLIYNYKRYANINEKYVAKVKRDSAARTRWVHALNGLLKDHKRLAQDVATLVADIKDNPAVSGEKYASNVSDCQVFSDRIQILTERIEKHISSLMSLISRQMPAGK